MTPIPAPLGEGAALIADTEVRELEELHCRSTSYCPVPARRAAELDRVQAGWDAAKEEIDAHQQALSRISDVLHAAGIPIDRNIPSVAVEAISDQAAEIERLRQLNREWERLFAALVDGLAERNVPTKLGQRYTAAALAEIDRLRAAWDEVKMIAMDDDEYVTATDADVIDRVQIHADCAANDTHAMEVASVWVKLKARLDAAEQERDRLRDGITALAAELDRTAYGRGMLRDLTSTHVAEAYFDAAQRARALLDSPTGPPESPLPPEGRAEVAPEGGTPDNGAQGESRFPIGKVGNRQSLPTESAAVIGPQIYATSAAPRHDTIINWQGRNFVPQVDRCYSCDHTADMHHPEGCWFTVEAGTPGRDAVCPCRVQNPLPAVAAPGVPTDTTTDEEGQ